MYDSSTEKYGVEKIKTLGDCYVACAGVPEKLDFHAERMVLLGIDMVKSVKLVGSQFGIDLNVRVGIHSGLVNSGVIGSKRVIYGISFLLLFFFFSSSFLLLFFSFLFKTIKKNN